VYLTGILSALRPASATKKLEIVDNLRDRLLDASIGAMAHSKYGRAEGWSPAAFTEARLRADMTLRVLSERLGVPRSTVASWGAGRAPKAILLTKIARALGVKKATLLDRPR
jgi:DNA-binding XRE family transcriptional regulator